MIRRAVATDVEALVALEADGLGADAWGAQAVRDELAADRIVLVADESPVTGYVDVSVAADVADLLRIVVSPSSRRSGTATALLEAAAARSVALGATRMLLEVSDANPGAIAFYDRLGFVPVSRRRRYYRDGADALVLERPLAQEP